MPRTVERAQKYIGVGTKTDKGVKVFAGTTDYFDKNYIGIRAAMAPRTALQNYQAIDTQGLTESQSPEQLILLLMEKAHSLLKQAKAAIECGNNESFYESTTKVAQIVLSLRELLDMESGV